MTAAKNPAPKTADAHALICVASPTRRPYTKAKCRRPAANRFLCEQHQKQYAAEQKAKADPSRRATTKATRKVEKKSNIVKLSDEQLARAADAATGAAPVPAEAMAAFASPDLAKQAVTKRRAERAPGRSK